MVSRMLRILLVAVVGVLVDSPLTGAAQISKAQRVVQETPLSTALKGAVPVVFSAPYIGQGLVTATGGSVVKDYTWMVPGNWKIYKSTDVQFGYKATVTRMAVSTITSSANMVAKITLYKNGQATALTCTIADTHNCAFNADVPMDVGDQWNIGVHLPKTATCASTGTNGCAGLTPIVTLMVRTGS